MPHDDRQVDRRTLLQLVPWGILGTSVSNAQSHCSASTQAVAKSRQYRFQFFRPEEVQLLEDVMERVIPQDDHSPGAHEARVIEFADLMIATGPDYIKDDWRAGARLLTAELKNTTLDKWMEMAAQHEGDPQTLLEIFFRSLKQMTINGYYSSAIGIHRELHYQGNTYVAEFLGCEHPEHHG